MTYNAKSHTPYQLNAIHLLLDIHVALSKELSLLGLTTPVLSVMISNNLSLLDWFFIVMKLVSFISKPIFLLNELDNKVDKLIPSLIGTPLVQQTFLLAM